MDYWFDVYFKNDVKDEIEWFKTIIVPKVTKIFYKDDLLNKSAVYKLT